MQLVTEEYRSRSPSTRPISTAHEPQSPSAQTTFVPCRFRLRRRNSESVTNASSPKTRRGRPLTYRKMCSRMDGPRLEHDAPADHDAKNGRFWRVQVVRD